MRTSRKFRWWGLYALIPLMIGLIALDDDMPMSETRHLVLLAAIAAVICGLALAWIERNARLVETDGLDGLSTYRVLLDTAEGASAEPVVQETFRTQDRTPAPGRDAAVPAAASQTMAADARVLS